MKIAIAGLSIYYEVQGKGQPVVLLHGWGTDSSSLRPLSGLLKNAADAKVYSVDLPGFGYSDPPNQDWDVTAYVQFLGAFLDYLALDQVTLLGHSFGGRVAIKFTVQQPQRVSRLVLVDSAGIRPRRTASYYLKVRLAKALNLVRRTFPRLGASLFFPPLGSTDYQNAGALRGTLVKVVNEDLRPFLPAIRCPTLLLWGENDLETPLADAYQMQGLIPNARLEIIPGAGHFSFQDNFAAFQAILPGFMREVRA